MRSKNQDSKLPSWIKTHPDGGCSLLLYVQPGASRTEVVGVHALDPPRLKLRIAAPATDSLANKALFAFLSKILGCSAHKLVLVQGETQRLKEVRCTHLEPNFVALTLNPPRSSDP